MRGGLEEAAREEAWSLTHKTVSFVSWLNASGTVPLISFPSNPKMFSSVIRPTLIGMVPLIRRPDNSLREIYYTCAEACGGW